MSKTPCKLCGALVCGHMPLTDAGKRMADAINAQLVIHGHEAWNLRSSWMRFHLLTGESDNTVYGSKSDAVRHAGWDADNYFYFCFRQAMAGVTSLECTRILAAIRIQKERGMYHVERDWHEDTILPVANEDVHSIIAPYLQRELLNR